jgi:hypothetical protein
MIIAAIVSFAMARLIVSETRVHDAQLAVPPEPRDERKDEHKPLDFPNVFPKDGGQV